LSALLEHPAVQGGVAPFVVALIVALALGRTRYAWLAILAGYLTMIVLSTGLSFSPLTASRKIVLIAILAAVAGLVADKVAGNSRIVRWILAAIGGVAAAWVFITVLQQRDAGAGWMQGLALFAFTGAMAWAMMSLRDDPLRAGAASVGLGVAAGIAAVLSAYIGALLAGIAIAVSAGALLLVWAISSSPAAPGLLGTLMVGVMAALFAEGALMLAQLPWYSLVLLLLVPLAVRLPVRETAPTIVRVIVLTAYALAAACIPIAAAWLAARSAVS